MPFLLKNNIHNVLAEVLFDEIYNRRANYYYYIGRAIDWTNPNDPDTPTDTAEYEYETRNDIISIKKIQPQDVSFVIPRRNWSSNVVYDQYDPDYSATNKSNSGASSLKDATFYVLSSHQGGYFNVYKCLFNNNLALSTERPSGSDPTPITYADGYVWKYMYTIPLNLRNKFLTQDYIPVSKAILNQYYSNGAINSVIVDNRGSGYSSNAQVTLSVECTFLGLPGNVSANVSPVLNDDGQFVDIIVTDSGNNIKTANIVINDTAGLGQSYYYQANSVIVTNNGAGYTSAAIANTTATVITTGTQPNANAYIALTFASSELNRIQIINGGSGYTPAIAANTVIQITTTGASQPTSNATANIYFNQDATFIPIVLSGRLENVLISDPGIDYSTNNETIVTITGDGEGANLVPYINSNGEVESIVIQERGIGYTYANIDIVGDGVGANAYAEFSVGDLNTIQSTVELSAINGAIYAIRMIDRGDGYTHANVALRGDGSDFVGNCIIENNTISKIDIINPGRNYTFANVIITGDGTNASGKAIMSPAGGHGRDPVRELFADTLMLYSTCRNDKIQGINIDNDYRQFGLIRNVEKFGDRDLFSNVIGSACYLITLDSTDNLEEDLELSLQLSLQSDNTISFSVITIIDDQILITNNNNHTLTTDDILVVEETNDTYQVLAIDKTPDINKFSGILMTIDNRSSTAYTEQQMVTLKSVIKL